MSELSISTLTESDLTRPWSGTATWAETPIISLPRQATGRT